MIRDWTYTSWCIRLSELKHVKEVTKLNYLELGHAPIGVLGIRLSELKHTSDACDDSDTCETRSSLERLQLALVVERDFCPVVYSVHALASFIHPG